MSVSIKNSEGITKLEQLDLPGVVVLCKENVPAAEADWSMDRWGINFIVAVTIVGPLRFKRYKGEWTGVSATLEVWPVPSAEHEGMEYITELSFGADTLSKAVENREILTEPLK